jgi:hypothetical protein
VGVLPGDPPTHQRLNSEIRDRIVGHRHLRKRPLELPESMLDNADATVRALMADGPCSASRLIVARTSRSGTPSGVGCSDVSRMFHLTPRATPLVEVTGPLK